MASKLVVVARWEHPDGLALRVVRWALWGREQAIYRWARGLDADDDPRRWIAGVALERRDGRGARWYTLSRQEIEGTGSALPEARLHGWEAGLDSHAAWADQAGRGASTPDAGAGPR